MSGFVDELIDEQPMGGCLGVVTEGEDGIGEVNRLVINTKSLEFKEIGGFCGFRNHYQAIKGKTPQDRLAVSFTVG